ncbi:MAG TPA: XRE family transcriptional regulator [Clostridiales bacterium]|mgnify:FL=1|jgi:transcriptional regulator with XRE-family HTH domain|uniref:Helix-turn-helix transcriptional regulator n=1 Tax=Congzhengia minquanensis TaxID=2763657 RepID=A0A926HYL7_9FIRM|nr:helix-turn-helix transcriptional regulator [Congzhengia minquanensis]MBC8539931.1 helix-turn-helix transcriptional regulator [Congzhengia minquanensis]MBD8946811.1 XRE family transcriptional regulator [Clostridiales bacterium]HBL82973.1 XRE family transcriptional regulator [Clostridiales bacterium]
MTFGGRLREIRSGKHSTQKQVADAVGVTVRNYQRYEADEQRPAFEVLIALADFFDISLDYLVGRTDNPKFYR